MFKIISGKHPTFENDVIVWGLVYVPGDQYVSLDFKSYFIKLEWGFTDV